MPDLASRPLIIGGMHRSGTSLTASLLASAGIDLGPELLGASPSNPLGHFEDVGFYEFHRRALVAQGIVSEGYTATSRGSVPAALEAEARGLVAARQLRGVAWGWKEPRTTLFLDFWKSALPDARCVFVFRRPWEVADSLFRRGDQAFGLDPCFAFDVWTHYNRLILDFARRHPTTSVVFEISQIIADPDAAIEAVRSRLDVPLESPGPQYREALFTSRTGAAHADLVRSIAPEAWRTYLDLRDLAGAVDALPTQRGRSVSGGPGAVAAWARSSRPGVGPAHQVDAGPSPHVVGPAQRVESGDGRRRGSRGEPTRTVNRASIRVFDGIVAAARRLRLGRLPVASATPPDVRPFVRAAETRAA
ncbi:MAG: sulfotransferase family protein [Planctomycetaceae bacterium]